MRRMMALDDRGDRLSTMFYLVILKVSLPHCLRSTRADESQAT